LKKNFD
jgi:hypothetical protein